MEKLEIKHMSPYLPHNTKVQVLREDQCVDYIKLTASQAMLIMDDYHFEPKLVLRPLSDFNQDQFKIMRVNFSNCPHFENYWGDWTRKKVDLSKTIIEHCVFDYLCSQNFDVFYLLGSDLAIDVNHLVENPYAPS